MKKHLIIVLCLSLFALPGCLLLAGGAAGGFSVAYVAGELQTEEEASIDEVYMAAQRALEALELTVTVREKDALSAKLVGHGAEDKKVTVRLERKSNRVTVVRIRVGLIGDQNASMAVLDNIEQDLGMTSPAPKARLPQDQRF